MDANGLLRAVAVGSTTVSATAVEFADAQAVSQPAVVRGLIELDSVVPTTAKFGELLEIYGVGLMPESLFAVAFGGVPAEIFDFTPVDPQEPQQLGSIRVWMTPPAGRRSALTVLGFNGGVVFPDTVNVTQRDVYEPNSFMPSALGAVPLGFQNPALAFEVRVRDDTIPAVDWYTFTNATTQDRTLALFSEGAGAETFSVFLTDSLAFDPFFGYFIGWDSWTIGPETYFCGGLGFTDEFGDEFILSEVPFPFTLIALKDLPAGEYHIFAPYTPSGEPLRYEMGIGSEYLSVLPPDAAEENDYCDVATPLGNVPSGTALTIDNFRDIDWYRFSVVPAGGQSLTLSTSSNEVDSDLDLYVVKNDLPFELPMIDYALSVGPDETLTIDSLGAGDYFLIVLEFEGIPTNYTLNYSFGAVIPSPRALAAPAASARQAALAAKRERAAASGRTRPTVRR